MVLKIKSYQTSLAPPVEKGNELAPLAIEINAPEKKELANVSGTTSRKGEKTSTTRYKEQMLAPPALNFGTSRNGDFYMD